MLFQVNILIHTAKEKLSSRELKNINKLRKQYKDEDTSVISGTPHESLSTLSTEPPKDSCIADSVDFSCVEKGDVGGNEFLKVDNVNIKENSNGSQDKMAASSDLLTFGTTESNRNELGFNLSCPEGRRFCNSDV